jgi:hypothetical protein
MRGKPSLAFSVPSETQSSRATPLPRPTRSSHPIAVLQGRRSESFSGTTSLRTRDKQRHGEMIEEIDQVGLSGRRLLYD